MEFLREVPSAALCDETSVVGGYSTYFADIFEPRPPIDDIQQNIAWVNVLQNNLATLLERPSMPIKSLSVYFDVKGAFLLTTFKHAIRKSPAATAVDFAMRSFPDREHRRILSTLHAFDELDKERIDAMQTVRSIQISLGVPSVAPSPPVVQHLTYDQLMLEPPAEVKVQSLAEFLEAESSDDDALALPDPGIVMDPRTCKRIRHDACVARVQLDLHTMVEALPLTARLLIGEFLGVAIGFDHSAVGFGHSGDCTVLGCTMGTGLGFSCNRPGSGVCC